MERPKRLSAAFVKSIDEPGRYGDGRGGHGLSLLVKQRVDGGVSKSWSQRLWIRGRRTNVGLGSHPVVSLAGARSAALKNAQTVAEGGDPRADRAIPAVPTFADAAVAVIELKSGSWRDGGKSASQWRSSLRDYAMPRLGRLEVSEITTSDVLKVLTPIWHEKSETARRVKQRISAIMDWSVAAGFRGDNPAGEALNAVLPKNFGTKRRQRALPHSEVRGAIERVRGSNGAWPATKLCFELMVLTATRSGEVRGAVWDEFDLDTQTWTIPPSRMKASREHRVPLSDMALGALSDAEIKYGGSGLVFPSPTGRPLSDSTMSKLLRELGVKAVPHGFRSSFRDWCAETGCPREIAEAALAHTVKGVEGAYFRSDLFEQRREIMQAWSTYLYEGNYTQS